MIDELTENLGIDPIKQDSPENKNRTLTPEEQFFAGVTLIALVQHKIISEKAGMPNISSRLSTGAGGRIRRVEYKMREEIVRLGDVEILNETVMMPTETTAADNLDEASRKANLHVQGTTIRKDDGYELRMRVFRDGGWMIDGAFFEEPVMSQQFREMQDMDDQGWGVKISTMNDYNQLVAGESQSGKWLTSAISHFLDDDVNKPVVHK